MHRQRENGFVNTCASQKCDEIQYVLAGKKYFLFHAKGQVFPGPLCDGSVVCRNDVRFRKGVNKTYGPYYLWIHKIVGEIVAVAISKNYRKLQKSLQKMPKSA